MSYGRDYIVRHDPKDKKYPWKVWTGVLEHRFAGTSVIKECFVSQHNTKEEATKEAKSLMNTDNFANGTLEIEEAK